MAEFRTLAGGLHVFTSDVESWWSNHVFFETRQLGVVVYDLPILNTDGAVLWERIQETTSGRMGLFIVSHGHPDHWGSLQFLHAQAPDVPILAARETSFYMRCTGQLNLELSAEWQPRLQGLPTSVTMPTELFEGERIIDAGDYTLRLMTTGPGEDTEHTVLYLPELRTILPNDLVYNGWHPWNEEERDGHWLRIIEWLRGFDAEVVVPGHGPVCGPEIYDDMERWLRAFQDLRLEYAGRYSIKDMPPENRRRMMEELEALFPDWITEEIPFSCGHMLAVPYSFRENRYSAEAL